MNINQIYPMKFIFDIFLLNVAQGFSFKELREKLKSEKGNTPAYDDQLVRNFIEKIEVFLDKLIFTMKAGMKIEVKI